jgi:alpha-amylase
VFFAAAACATPRALSSVRPAAVPARTVMLQLFEWPWKAVGEECEKVIGPAGFSAVQVSPPQEHIVVRGAPWWERYQPVSYKLESRSGGEAAFAAMVGRCARAGVDVYADVVLNHMNAQKEGRGFAGTSFTHYRYDGLWSYADFHHCGRNGDDGLVHFTDLYELQNCELLGMADLDTGAAHVQGTQAAYLGHLLDLGVKGFRVDAAKHMAAADLAGLFGRLKRPNYRVLELILSPGEPVSAGDYLPVGDVNNFAYAYELGAAFRGGNLSSLPGLAAKTGLGTDDAVVFVENHDLERRPAAETLLSLHQDPALNRLGLVFLLTWPYGYPAVYSGYSFTDGDAGPPLDARGVIASPLAADGSCRAPFTCAHRAPWLRKLVGFRNLTDKAFAATDVWTSGPAVFAFGRGEAGHVVISVDAQARPLEVPTRLKPGRYCNLLDERDCAEVDASHVLHLQLKPRSAFVALDPERAKRR